MNLNKTRPAKKASDSAAISARLEVTEHEVIEDLSDSVFAGQPGLENFQPDDFKAYVRLRICHALPNLIGPEMNSGITFAFHPAALARNYLSLLHQQTNIGHRLRANGTAANDAINGCIIAVSYPEGWEETEEIPASGGDAPYIEALAVMFKKAHGVKGLLGEHLSSRKKWSVSIETDLRYSECGIYDTRDGSLKELADLEEGEYRIIKGAPRLSKVDGGQLVWVLGGKDGTSDFPLKGLGYVPKPAEKTAKITELAAAHGSQKGVMIAAGEEPDFFEGVRVSWEKLHKHCWGQGEVQSVAYEGEVVRHKVAVQASAADPVLLIKMPNGVEVARPASSVAKTA